MAVEEMVLRLAPGDDLRRCLEAAYREAGNGAGTGCCVLAAVGSLSVAVLRYAGRDGGTRVEKPLEIVSLSGTLSRDGVHLHASVSDAEGQVLGGHVMPGCTVRTTAEIVLGWLPAWEFRRAHDPATGFLELQAVRRDG